MSNKTLLLKSVNKTYTDKTSGTTREFSVYVVTVNGIDVQLKPLDNTARSILQSYFKD